MLRIGKTSVEEEDILREVIKNAMELFPFPMPNAAKIGVLTNRSVKEVLDLCRLLNIDPEGES